MAIKCQNVVMRNENFEFPNWKKLSITIIIKVWYKVCKISKIWNYHESALTRIIIKLDNRLKATWNQVRPWLYEWIKFSFLWRYFDHVPQPTSHYFIEPLHISRSLLHERIKFCSTSIKMLCLRFINQLYDVYVEYVWCDWIKLKEPDAFECSFYFIEEFHHTRNHFKHRSMKKSKLNHISL